VRHFDNLCVGLYVSLVCTTTALPFMLFRPLYYSPGGAMGSVCKGGAYYLPQGVFVVVCLSVC